MQQPPRRACPGRQRNAEVGISLGIVRLDADRLAICGDRLVELALVLECIAEVGISLGIVRLDADRLAICGDRLVKLAPVFSALPRLE